jgi:hypothetical protein
MTLKKDGKRWRLSELGPGEGKEGGEKETMIRNHRLLRRIR